MINIRLRIGLPKGKNMESRESLFPSIAFRRKPKIVIYFIQRADIKDKNSLTDIEIFRKSFIY